MSSSSHEIAQPVLKVVTAWTAIGVSSWAEAASLLAAMYTFLLITEWLWKKLIKPALIRLGYLPVPARRATDHTCDVDEDE